VTTEIPITVETERLLLRPWSAEDLDALFAMHSRPDVALFTYWDARTRDEVRVALAKKTAFSAIRAEGDILALAAALRGTGEVIGDLVLHWLPGELRQGELGFIVHPDQQGRGYATEAAGQMLRIAFEDVGLHRVVGCVEERNTASARVLEKLGMRREAHFVENEFVKGEWQSELVYAILDREWLAAQG
jgi:RimJ/RimL family protein N-acetyltransferase